MTDITLIGLCGLKRAGKDTAAGFLAEYGFKRLAFADKLYAEVAQNFGVTTDFLGNAETKETPLAELSLINSANSEFVEVMLHLDTSTSSYHEKMMKPRSPRQVMQAWGTEFRRERYGETYWTDGVVNVIRSQPNQKWVITDVRFPNEAQVLKDIETRQAQLLRIVREGQKPGTDLHASEVLMLDYSVDQDVLNVEGKPQVLKHNLEEFLTQTAAVGCC